MSDDDEDQDVPAIKPLTIVKYRNFEDTFCFRRSAMNGILSGFGLGLTHFMFTSNIAKSTKITLLSGMCVYIGYWFYCRREQANARFLYNRLGPELQKLMDEKGTDQVPNSESNS